MRGNRTYSDLRREEATMRKKMTKLAKQAGKHLAILPTREEVIT
jgi:hypothetical protein